MSKASPAYINWISQSSSFIVHVDMLINIVYASSILDMAMVTCQMHEIIVPSQLRMICIISNTIFNLF